jgi:hypothetical protein
MAAIYVKITALWKRRGRADITPIGAAGFGSAFGMTFGE